MKPVDLSQDLQHRLKAFIARRIPDEAGVADVLQEVLLRIHQKLQTLKDGDRLVGWVYRITRHAIIDYYRALGRRRETPVGLTGDLEALPSLPLARDEDEAAADRLRQELVGCLRPMLRQLSPEYREAVTLVELDGLTQLGAAQRLGLSLSGMKSRVQRGRRQLKELLEACCEIQVDARGRPMGRRPRRAACDPCRTEGTAPKD